MKKENFPKLNDLKLIYARDNYFSKLKSIFDGNKPDNIFRINGVVGSSKTDRYKDPEKWVEEALASLNEQAEVILDKDVFKPVCLECGLYDVHFIDKMLGAEVFFESGQWYNKYLDAPVGNLAITDIEENEVFILAKRIANAFTEYGLKLPLFGLPTIASSLNIAINLYGEKILVAMCSEEEEEDAVHDLTIINNVLCEIHKWYIDKIPFEQLQPVVSCQRTQPPGFGQICGCTTQLLSPRLYRDFVAPLDDKLLSVYSNGGMIHLCGSHSQHIPVWREMNSLRAVQLNDRAAWDLNLYFNGLREDQIIYLTPCEGMTVESAMKITKGHRLVIQGD